MHIKNTFLLFGMIIKKNLYRIKCECKIRKTICDQILEVTANNNQDQRSGQTSATHHRVVLKMSRNVAASPTFRE